MRTTSIHFRSRVFLLLAFMLPVAPGVYADEAFRNELFHARLENLQQKLVVSAGHERLLRLRPDVQVRLGESERRELAGLVLERRQVQLSGLSGSVLDWLGRARGLRYALTPPMIADWRGRSLRLSLNMWSVSPGEYDAKAARSELEKLEANLLWFGGQLDPGTKSHLALLSRLLESELVFVEELEWSGGMLKPRGVALDASVRRAFVDDLGAQLKTLPHPPRLHAKGVLVQTPPDKLQAKGVHAADLDPATVFLETARLAGRELMAVLPVSGPGLSGHLLVDRPAQVIPLVAERLGLAAVERNRVWVVAPELRGQVAAGRSLPLDNRPMNLQHLKLPAESLWSMVTEGGSASWLVASAPGLLVTTLLRERPIREVVSLLAWAQGLRVESLARGRLLAPVPEDWPTFDEAKGEQAGERVQLSTVGAPAGMLLEPLLSSEASRCAGAERLISGRIPPMSAGLLRQVLLAVADLRLEPAKAGRAVLTARARPAGECEPMVASGLAEPGSERLAAVLRRGKKKLSALVWVSQGWRWVAPGDELGPDSKVLRVNPAEVLIAEGQTERRLAPSAPKDVSARSFDPAQFRLSRLRLAATLHFVGGQARALIEDPLGGMHSVGLGDMAGRRCGKVISITPGRLGLQLACPGPGEPQRAELFLRGR